MDKPLKLFGELLLWNDSSEEGTFTAIMLAPDAETAERLTALAMLKAEDKTLFDHFLDCEGKATLKRYYDEHGPLGAWSDMNGRACPNCTSHAGGPDGGHIEVDGAQLQRHVCRTCGFAWFPAGFDEATRSQLENDAHQTIAALDQIERESAGDGEDEEIEE